MTHVFIFLHYLVASVLIVVINKGVTASPHNAYEHQTSHTLTDQSQAFHHHQEEPERREGIVVANENEVVSEVEKKNDGEYTIKGSLQEDGFTRVIYDEEGLIPDHNDDYYYDYDTDPGYLHPQKESEMVKAEKAFTELFPKKFWGPHEEKKTPFKQKDNDDIFGLEGVTDPLQEWMDQESEKDIIEVTLNPSMTSEEEIVETERVKKKDPVVLPVTTEGKAGPKQKTEDPLKVYGFPKELMPIMPGGGSRFEDVEREKLEKKKLSQTKGSDDDSAENGGSHEAEGLYSSASFSSLSLCFYLVLSLHRLDRILLL